MSSYENFGHLHEIVCSGNVREFRALLQKDNCSVKRSINKLVKYGSGDNALPAKNRLGWSPVQISPKRANVNTKEKQDLMFELPLALAATSGKREMLLEVFKLCDDVCQKDSATNNIVHCLVVLSDRHPRVACHMYKSLMKELKDVDSKKTLLYARNTAQQTALSLAADLCVPEMLLAITNTSHVYRTEDQHLIGPYRQVTYKFQQKDIFEVISQLTNAPCQKLQQLTDTDLFYKPPFSLFRQKFHRSHRWLFAMFMTIMFINVLVFLLYARRYFSTGTIPSTTHSSLLAGFMLLGLLITLKNLWLSRKNLKEFCKRICTWNKEPTVVSIGLGPVFFLAIGLSLAILDLTIPDCERYHDLRHSLYVGGIFDGIMSLCYFSYLFENTAYLMEVMRRMLRKSLTFFMVAFLPYVAFSVVFSTLETPFECVNELEASNATANEREIQVILYNSLLRLLNVQIPADVHFDSTLSRCWFGH